MSLPNRLISRWTAATALACVVAVGAPSSARAQTASEKAAAEALFDEGVELLRQKKFEEACKKLESSQRVDPGIGTLLYLGECYKQLGRTASAWATFREAASKAEAIGQGARARTGMDRADAIEGSLSKVTFEVAEENRGIADLEIMQAGLKVSRALWGTEVPVDPGEVTVKAMAPGYESFEITVQVEKGPASMSVKIPALVALPETEQPPEEEPVAAPAAATSDSGVDDAKDPGAGRRTAGIAVGSAGLVGIGLGSVFGILAMNKDKAARDVCDENNLCPAGENGEKLTNQAQTFATVSTIAFAAGGALLAGGIVLYVTAPKSRETAQLQFSPLPGGGHFTLGTQF